MSIKLPDIETQVLSSWEKNDTFKKTLVKSKERAGDKRPFNFYDGPPFATGSPHYGHVLAATIKDVVCRSQTIRGNYVPRINGWDTHGLPAEQLVEKYLGIKNKQEIIDNGIQNFNKVCREKVLDATKEWEKTIPRVGRWVDFENGYKTMDFEFMNAVWGVFKVIYEKDLVYHSLVPMPFSTGCGSCLSHFEAKSNYQDVQDPSIVLRYPLIDLIDYLDLHLEVNLLVWTTTPYSLTANLALCINSKIKYVLVEVQDQKSSKTIEYIIIAELSLEQWKQKDYNYLIKRSVNVSELLGKKYKPPYDFFLDHPSVKAFSILEDSYVKTDTGTGIVHLAPGLGEDDYRVCLKENIIDPHQASTIISPIDDQGALVVPDDRFNGKYVKSVDKDIIKDLRDRGLLWSNKTLTHSYPFCYRTDTPLIQKAIPSWFINIHEVNDTMLELNKGIHWVPSSVGENRFHQWIKEPRDWSFGRSRFWGTPVPIWVSDNFDEVICVGSVTELEQLAGLKMGSITDLHREQIDHLKIFSRNGTGQQLKRIDDVFDCWFESGAMPYGKYAVENKFRKDEIYQILSGNDSPGMDNFIKTFPADFIGEGLDQTRGWFYTLLVISTILFKESAYKNVIVNGLVLAELPNSKGKWIKMSKRYHNYPDPNEVLDKYGADSLRLYLLDSPVVKSEALKFKETGIEQKGRFLVQWLNCFQFLEQEIKFLNLQKKDTDLKDFKLIQSTQIYDQWILGELSKVVKNVTKHYSNYHLYLAVPELIKFEELFSRWYLNLAKQIMKGQYGEQPQRESLSTFYSLLKIFSILISPITPFMSEYIYQNLTKLIPNNLDQESVHMELLDDHKLQYNSLTNQQVSRMVEVVMAVRSIKDGACISPRHKSKSLILRHLNQEFLDDIKALEKELRSVIKVDKIQYELMKTSENDLKIEFNKGFIGQIAKKDAKNILIQLNKLNIKDFVGRESIQIEKFEISSDVWKIIPVVNSEDHNTLVNYTNNGLLVLLSKEVLTTTQENIMELILKKIQKAKKDLKLKTYQKVDIYLQLENKPENEGLTELITQELEEIKNRLRSDLHLLQIEKDKKTIGHWDAEGYQFDISLQNET